MTTHKQGTVTITATLPNGKKASCKIEVPKPTFKLNHSSSSIYKGKTVDLKVIANPANQKPKVTWSSSNKKIATVSSSGKVKGVGAGNCTITAKLSTGKKLTCKVTVKVQASVVNVSDYLNNPSGLSKKKNSSFTFKSKNGKVTYAKISNNKASFRGLKPGNVNTAEAVLWDYELISTKTFYLGETLYFKKKSTGEKLYVTDYLLVIDTIEYYRK